MTSGNLKFLVHVASVSSPTQMGQYDAINPTETGPPMKKNARLRATQPNFFVRCFYSHCELS